MAACLAMPYSMHSCRVGERLTPSEFSCSLSEHTRSFQYVSAASSVTAKGANNSIIEMRRRNLRCGALPQRVPSSFLSSRHPRYESSCGRRKVQRAAKVVAVLDVTDATFEEEVLKSQIPVLVDFWDTWCGPCKLVAPLMNWAEKEYEGQLKVVKIQADPNPTLVAEYKVYGLPTLIIFSGGQEVEDTHIEGAISKAKLASYLKEKLPALVHK